jgi:hypothetical protein
MLRDSQNTMPSMIIINNLKLVLVVILLPGQSIRFHVRRKCKMLNYASWWYSLGEDKRNRVQKLWLVNWSNRSRAVDAREYCFIPSSPQRHTDYKHPHLPLLLGIFPSNPHTPNSSPTSTMHPLISSNSLTNPYSPCTSTSFKNCA